MNTLTLNKSTNAVDVWFDERIKGSHHIFRKAGVVEMVNLQRDGNKVKAYQIQQLRKIILKYDLHNEK